MIKKNTGFKTKATKALLPFLIMVFMMVSYLSASAQQKELMVRIAEIEIDPAYLEEFKAILAEEAAASVKLEPGVIVIFPMYQKENPSQVRILEMYASQAAYEQHIKNATLPKVQNHYA